MLKHFALTELLHILFAIYNHQSQLKNDIIDYITQPSWANHISVFIYNLAESFNQFYTYLFVSNV